MYTGTRLLSVPPGHFCGIWVCMCVHLLQLSYPRQLTSLAAPSQPVIFCPHVAPTGTTSVCTVPHLFSSPGGQRARLPQCSASLPRAACPVRTPWAEKGQHLKAGVRTGPRGDAMSFTERGQRLARCGRERPTRSRAS